MHSPERRVPSGFTLIEVLVAISIFAVMSVMAFRVLSTVLDSRERVERENRKWREIAIAVARIEQDLLAFRDRRIRDSGGIEQPSLVGVQVPLGDQGHIMLTRAGYTDQPGARAAPQRVGYRLRDGTLEQLQWPVLDQAQRTRPTVSLVLRGVTGFDLRYLDIRTGLSGNQGWLNQWPPPGSFQTQTPGTGSAAASPPPSSPPPGPAPGTPGAAPDGAAPVPGGPPGGAPGAAGPAAARDPIPGAVEMTLTLATGERIQRVFPFLVRESRK